MRVLIVDDSAFMRKMITAMISSDPAFEIVGTARNGDEGVTKAIELKPDLITLDIEMPIKDGLTALREIKARCHSFQPAVLMCSSLTVAGSNEAFKALRIGAADVIGKDPTVVGQNDQGFKAELLEKLHAIGGHRSTLRKQSPTSTRPTTTKNADLHPNETLLDKELDLSRVKAIAVGSSTGGPPVLEEIFSKLSASLNIPIIVAQHMPELFTKSLATRLNQYCACSASLATHGTLIAKPGIYIAQGGSHIKLTKIAGGKIVSRLLDTLEGAIYRPSVDLLFESAAEIFGDSLLAIQLTGMGSDGAKGAQVVKKLGGQIITQSSTSCVVYGMPKAVVDLNLSDCVMNPADIRDMLAQLNSAKTTLNLGNACEHQNHLRSA